MDTANQHNRGLAEDGISLHTSGDSISLSSNIAVKTDNDMGNNRNEVYQRVRRWCCYDTAHKVVGDYPALEKRVNILLLGEVGTGKSSLGNLILGRNHLEIANNFNPCTNDYHEAPFDVGGFSFCIMDTPGLFDKNNVQNIAENVMIRWRTIDVIILVFRMDTRFAAVQQEMVSKIEQQFGTKLFKYCLVVFTHADHTTEKFPSLSEFKALSGKFLSGLISKVFNRIIAVHKSDRDAEFQQAQRNQLLCAVLNLVGTNSRETYTKQYFDVAAELTQEAQRRNKTVSKMNMVVSSCILSSSRNELRRLVMDKDISNAHIDKIINLANISSLEGISKPDIISYAKNFVKANIDTFENQLIQTTTIQEGLLQETEKNLKKEEKQRQEVIMKNVFKGILKDYLTALDENAFGAIKSNGKITEDRVDELKTRLKNTHIVQFFEDSDIDRVIRDVAVTRDLVNVVRMIEVDRQILKREQLQELKEHLKDELSHLISSGDILSLKMFLEEKYPTAKDLKWNRNRCRGLITEDDINQEIENYLKTQMKHIKRTYDNEFSRQKEVLRKEIICLVVDELNGFLLGKNKKELIRLKMELVFNKVPSEIAYIVHSKLSKEMTSYFSAEDIDRELLSVLKAFIDTVQTITKKACFPGQSFVKSKLSGFMSIASLQIGSQVLTLTSDNVLKYQDVFLIAHACPFSNNAYVKIVTARNKVIHLSPNHYILVGEPKCLKTACDVKVNDMIFSEDVGIVTTDRVTSVEMTVLKGAYCPYTLNGMIIVDAVATSCFTTTVSPAISQQLLAPLRFLYMYMPLPLYKFIFSPTNVSACLNFVRGVKEFAYKWKYLLSEYE